MQKSTRNQKHNYGSLLQHRNNLHSKSDHLQILLSGKSNRKTQIIYIWAVFLALTAVSIVAQILFPADFSLLSHTISQQGSIVENPIGSIIWRIGVIFNGLAHIPHILYIEHHLKPIDKQKSKFVRWIGIVSAIAFSFVGTFSIEYGIIHYIMALIAFWGYFITANFSFSIIKKALKQKSIDTMKSDKIHLISRYFQLYFNLSGILCLGSFIFNKFFLNLEVWPPFEWNYLIAICIWLLIWPWIVKIIDFEKKTKC